MGLVKFNNTTLNIENVPDGARIIDEATFQRFTETQNAYALLKSKMPIGVSEDQLSVLVEKGQRYDQVNTELVQAKSKVEEVSGKLQKLSNIPENFTVEQWNKDRAAEAKAIRDGKINTLTAAVVEKLKKDYPDKTPPKIDPRFMPADKVAAFNPDDANAQDNWAKIMGEAHQAQTEFLKTIGGSDIPTPSLGGAGKTNETPAPGQPIVAPSVVTLGL